MHNRRQFIGVIGGVGTMTIAGCTGSDDSNPNEDHVESMVEAMEEHVEVIDWYISEEGSEYVGLDFETTGEEETDLQIVGGAYAGAVDNGLDLPIYVDVYQFGEIAYDLYIEPDPAQAFMDDEITEAEYLEIIEDTVFR